MRLTACKSGVTLVDPEYVFNQRNSDVCEECFRDLEANLPPDYTLTGFKEYEKSAEASNNESDVNNIVSVKASSVSNKDDLKLEFEGKVAGDYVFYVVIKSNEDNPVFPSNEQIKYGVDLVNTKGAANGVVVLGDDLKATYTITTGLEEETYYRVYAIE